MRPIGIRDVAELAGVSISTVSTALNNPDRVSERSSHAVAAAVESLGYVPNHAARQLRNGRSRTIGIAVPDLGDPVASEIVHGALDAAARAGNPVIVADGAGNTDHWERTLRRLAGHQVGGILVDPGPEPSPALGHLLSQIATVVRIGSSQFVDAACSITVDHEADGRRATELLLAGGPGGRVVVVTGTESTTVLQDILTGSRTAASGHGSLLDVLRPDEPTSRGGRRLGALLASGRRIDLPDGILCTDTAVAVGLVQGLLGAGIRVPHDVAVVGLGDGPLADAAAVPLTTLRRRGRILGGLGLDAVLDSLAARATTATISLASDVVHRRSTKSSAFMGKLLHK